MTWLSQVQVDAAPTLTVMAGSGRAVVFASTVTAPAAILCGASFPERVTCPAPARAHPRDETEFISAAQAGTLPSVSFVKPYATENEHPGSASEPNGS